MERFGVMMCNGVPDVPRPPVTLVRTSVKTPRAAKWWRLDDCWTPFSLSAPGEEKREGGEVNVSVPFSLFI